MESKYFQGINLPAIIWSSKNISRNTNNIGKKFIFGQLLVFFFKQMFLSDLSIDLVLKNSTLYSK